MRQFSWLFLLGVCLFTITLSFGSACQRQPAQTEQQPQYTPTATIKDLMDSIVDSSADVVWESVTTTVSAAGTVEKAPRNDEEWTNVRRGAIRLVEASNLLLMPGRHMARPGEKSEAPGIELEPDEMEALVKKDPAGWSKRAKGLYEAAMVMLRAAEAKDTQKVLDAGERLENACENCHLNYWYPNQVLPPGYEESARRNK